MINRFIASNITHGCAVFSGVGSSILLPNSITTLNPQLTGDYTFEFWVKRNADGVIQQIFHNETPMKGIYLAFTSSNNIYLQHNGNGNWGTGNGISTNVSLPKDTWTHISITRSVSEGLFKSYVNGEFKLSATCTAVSASDFGGAVARIGSTSSGTANHLNGNLDEFRIWNYARTAQQILDNYNKVIKPQTGLIAYYKLDGNALDSSGNGNHGTATNVGYSVDGKVPVTQVTEFDGVTGKIDIPNSVNYPSGSLFSIESWFYPSAFTSGKTHAIIRRNGHYLIQVTSSGALVGYTYLNGVYQSISSSIGSVIINKWNHLVCNYDGVNLKIYVNGVLLGSSSLTGAGSSLQNSITIGYYGSTEFAHGKIGLTRLWSKALTQQEIHDNMYKVLPSTTTGLIEQWVLNGNALGTKGNNGTLVGGVKFIADAPTTQADVSTALQRQMLLTSAIKVGCGVFDGNSGNYITCPTGISLVNKSFTVEYWSKLNVITEQDHMIVANHEASSSYKSLHIGYRLGQGTNTIHLGFFGSDLQFTYPRTDMLLWHHYAFTFDAVSKIRCIYIDGVMVASGTSPSNFSGNAPITIGRWLFRTYGTNASIGEVRLWDVNRSAQEIMTNYKTSLKPQTGLIAQYKLDGNTFDTSGNNNHGTMVGSVAWSVDGKVPVTQVADFDGVDDTISINNTPSLNPTQFITIESWVKPILSGTNVYIRKENQYFIRTTSKNINGYLYINGGWQVVSVTDSYNTVEWMLVTMTYDGTNIKLYKNAILIGSFAVSGSINVTTNNVSIGSLNGTSQFTTGNISLTRIWSKALTQQEIQDNMFKILPSTTTGLIEQWTLNGNALGTKGNNGTLVGGVKFIADAPKQVADVPAVLEREKLLSVGGVVSNTRSSLKFNGINTYIDTINMSNLNLQEYSVEVWVRIDGNSSLGVSYGDQFIAHHKNTFQSFFEAMMLGYRESNKTFSAIQANGTSGTQKRASSNPITFGRWYHVTATFNINEVSIFVDGVKHSSVPTGFVPVFHATDKMRIGQMAATANGYINGCISLVRCWNKTLTNNDILSNMYRSLPASTPNLIEQWKLDEGTGTIAYGTKGSNGTITGSTTWTTPSNMNYVGKCFNNTSGTNYIMRPANASMSTNAGLTLEAWINPSTGGSGYIISKEYEYWLAIFSGTIQYAIRNTSPGWAGINTSVAIPESIWTHVALVYDLSTITLYVNGILSYTRTNSTGFILKNTTNELSIGNRPSYPAQFFGKLDEVRVWHIARTQAEIQENMYKTMGRHPNLVLNMGFESDYWDSSGYGNHGIPVGSPLIEVTDNNKLLLNAPVV
jgi:hypothetical protein